MFNTLLTSTLQYRVKIWGQNIYIALHWKDLERSLVSMIACMIRSKTSVPEDITAAEMWEASTVTKEFRIQKIWEVPKQIYSRLAFMSQKQLADHGDDHRWNTIQIIWGLPKQRYSRLTFMSLKQLAGHGDGHCWNAKMQERFQLHTSINTLTPFQYN